MIERILALSIRGRWLVAFLTLIVAGFGLWQMTAAHRRRARHHQPPGPGQHLQPDPRAGGYGKQVTYPVETALAGIPGLKMTRSSRATASAR
jgi:cobalt-zinc-cadmium resistance protein CzcA